MFIPPVIPGLICAVAYAYLARLSLLPGRVDLFALLSVHFFIAAVLIAYWCYAARRKQELSVAAVIFYAALFRVIGVFGAPILEDDYFRYLLDGCVFVSTGSPYGIPPMAMFGENPLPAECQILLSRVNNPHVATIYAPVLQYLFAAAYLVAPLSVRALQAAVSTVDLAVIWLLCKHAPARNVMLYAWCPLAVKEIAFTAHPDIVGAALILFAFHFRARRPAAAAALGALACATKAFVWPLLPFLLWRMRAKYWALAAGVFVACYLPFVLQNATDFAGLSVFLQRWRFNPAVYAAVAAAVGPDTARIICHALFAAVWLGIFVAFARRDSAEIFPRGEWILGALLLFSPVVNSWYVLWFLPFAVLRPQLWAWTWATVAPLSYVVGLNLLDSDLGAYQLAGGAYYSYWGAVAVAAGVDVLRRRMLCDAPFVKGPFTPP